jgi:hypothetical protein
MTNAQYKICGVLQVVVFQTPFFVNKVKTDYCVGLNIFEKWVPAPYKSDMI